MLTLLLRRRRHLSVEVGRGTADAAPCCSECYCDVSDLTCGISVVHVVDQVLPTATSKHHHVTATSYC